MPVPSTITAEAARTLITFSGATIIPDIPEHYNKHPEILRFISAQRMPWQESKTLSGEIGEYIVMARRAADGNWLIAAATNETARTIKIPLSIIDKGNYEALIIQDGTDADYRTNKESSVSTIRTVNKTQTIEVKLAPGGGACILLQLKGHQKK
jgi:alpha-glucosidase